MFVQSKTNKSTSPKFWELHSPSFEIYNTPLMKHIHIVSHALFSTLFSASPPFFLWQTWPTSHLWFLWLWTWLKKNQIHSPHFSKIKSHYFSQRSYSIDLIFSLSLKTWPCLFPLFRCFFFDRSPTIITTCLWSIWFFVIGLHVLGELRSYQWWLYSTSVPFSMMYMFMIAHTCLLWTVRC